jgi:signal transduction histidine kinase
LAEQKGVRLEVSGTMEAAFHGDPDLLGRLVLNLLDNGIKHAPEGGRVEVTMAEGEEALEIRVIDSGPGIAPSAQARIFERFFQTDAARTRPGNTLTSGAGLGLAIGRRIAEMHGGGLELAGSQPGRTEFLLTLPAGGVQGPDPRAFSAGPE